MGRKNQYTAEQVAAAIEGTGGIVSTVAHRLGCTWHTARRHIDKWESTREIARDEEEAIIDMAESLVVRSLRDGDSSMAKWILMTKGKRRGYSEKHQIEHSGGIHVSIDSDDSKL